MQAMNENKKIHQFKAYDTLDPSFIQKYLKTYPKTISVESLMKVTGELTELFKNVLSDNPFYIMEDDLQRLLEEFFV